MGFDFQRELREYKKSRRPRYRGPEELTVPVCFVLGCLGLAGKLAFEAHFGEVGLPALYWIGVVCCLIGAAAAFRLLSQRLNEPPKRRKKPPRPQPPFR
ncbi:MAG: hypothetical protein AAF907_00425 [Planctomycetota bacterium]